MIERNFLSFCCRADAGSVKNSIHFYFWLVKHVTTTTKYLEVFVSASWKHISNALLIQDTVVSKEWFFLVEKYSWVWKYKKITVYSNKQYMFSSMKEHKYVQQCCLLLFFVLFKIKPHHFHTNTNAQSGLKIFSSSSPPVFTTTQWSGSGWVVTQEKPGCVVLCMITQK